MDFIDFFPIHVIDIRKHSESLKTAAQNIILKVVFDAVVPANTTTYAVLISDKILRLEADGSKFSVLLN